jgi:hypothetical protein
MLRRICCAAAIVMACLGVAVAEEFTGIISKVDGNKVTFRKFSKDKKEKAEEQTLPAKDGVKVVTAKFNKDTKKVEAGDEVAGGLKSDVFAKGGKGVMARIVTSDDNKTITEIRVFQLKKKDAK